MYQFHNLYETSNNCIHLIINVLNESTLQIIKQKYLNPAIY